MIYSFYLFNRNGICIYYKDWHRRSKPKNQGEEFKLIYGLIYSLKSFNSKISPDPASDGTFNFFSTNSYKFHYYETPTGLKFCLMSDPTVPDKREILKMVYTIYVRYVVLNPLYNLNDQVTEELFAENLDKYIKSHQAFSAPDKFSLTSSTSPLKK